MVLPYVWREMSCPPSLYISPERPNAVYHTHYTKSNTLSPPIDKTQGAPVMTGFSTPEGGPLVARGAGNYGLGPIYYYLFPIISKEESYISRCKTLCDGRKKEQT